HRRRSAGRVPNPAVLDALDELGEHVFSSGINKLKWIVPAQRHRKGVTVEFVPETIPKIKRSKQQSLPLDTNAPALPFAENLWDRAPLAEQGVLEGMLEITDGKARIRPILGSPTVVSFGSDLAENVLEAAHKPVRVQLDPTNRKIAGIEVTEP